MSEIIVGAIQNPLLSQSIVNGLQNDLANLIWLERIYPFAYVGEVIKDGVTHKIPRVYKNVGENDYIDITPDDSLKGMVFFELEGDYSYDRNEEEITITVSAIFWANMKVIGSKGYDYRHELVADAMKAFKNGSQNNTIETFTITENYQDILSKYDLDDVTLQMFMYPFTAFKLSFDMDVTLDLDCITDFEIC